MKKFYKDLRKHLTKIINYIQVKKINHIVNKVFVIYAKNLVLMIKDIIESEIIVIIPENIQVLLKIFLT